MEKTIDLQDLFNPLKRRFFLIIATGLLAVGVTWVINHYYFVPTYRASTELVVNSATATENGRTVTADAYSGVQLINTYTDILRSPAILNIVSEELNLSESGEELRESVTVTNETDSQVMTLKVTNEDPDLACDIANTTARVFQEEIDGILNVNNVSILAEATHALAVGPTSIFNMTTAFIVGAIAGIGMAFLLDYLDKTVKTERDIEKLLGVPVLGAIPGVKNWNGK